MTVYDIIKKPVISQKSYRLAGMKQVVFHVNKQANAPMIKKAVEEMFSVKVVRVNTHIKKDKAKRVGRVIHEGKEKKYAYVTLAKGYEINFFEQQVANAQEDQGSSGVSE